MMTNAKKDYGIYYKLSIGTAILSLLLTMGYSAKAVASETHSVSGVLHCPENFVPPPNAIAYITLTDVSPRQDSTSAIVARQVVHQPCQDPISFELTYDPTKISEHYLYAIQAQISAAGEVILRNSSAHPVITQGHPTVVEVYVEPMDSC
ncbi:MAG: YbaY family lipoprotein [Cyanobacteria bacterium J06626_14]